MNQENLPGLVAGSKLFQSYDEMYQAALNCTQCSLCETRTNVVIEDGNRQAKLMFIGEGPGEHEDLQGIPFVGKAGQLLNKILVAAGIDRQTETFICNVVKCRPPGNRVPSEAEALGCWGYLQYQIEYIQPKIIVFLGSSALKYALKLKNPRITKLHGQWFDNTEVPDTSLQKLYQDKYLMPFYHPSYLLRNASKEKGSPKWQAWEAIQVIRQKLTEISSN